MRTWVTAVRTPEDHEQDAAHDALRRRTFPKCRLTGACSRRHLLLRSLRTPALHRSIQPTPEAPDPSDPRQPSVEERERRCVVVAAVPARVSAAAAAAAAAIPGGVATSACGCFGSLRGSTMEVHKKQNLLWTQFCRRNFTVAGVPACVPAAAAFTVATVGGRWYCCQFCWTLLQRPARHHQDRLEW